MIIRQFRYGAWEWPDTLAPLMQWAERRLIDVYSFKSDRQAFFMIKDVAKQKMRLPKRGNSCVPHLMKLQRTLCPSGKVKAEKPTGEITRVHGLGTFGAADEGRRVSVEEYLRERGAA